MKNPPRRFRFSLGKLLLILLFVFVLLSRWVSPLNEKSDGIIHRIFQPALSLSRAIWNPLEKIWHHYFFVVGLQEENQKLKKENAELKQKNSEIQSQLRASVHFQEILSLWKNTPYHPKLAEVIAYDPLDPSSGLWINRGSEDAVAVGQVVVAAEGLVGIVSKVFSGTAKIIPILSPHSSLDVELTASGLRGILKGTQKIMGLDRRYWLTKMEYVGSPEKIETGEEVTTSGLDKVFPRGLLVGKIQSPKKDEKGLFVSAEVLPEVDFSKLREVAVLIP